MNTKLSQQDEGKMKKKKYFKILHLLKSISLYLLLPN